MLVDGAVKSHTSKLGLLQEAATHMSVKLL
jgi:hypothetical protein